MTGTPDPRRVEVTDASLVPAARRAATEHAAACGLPQQVRDQVALAATELAENLHRHAVGGELLLLSADEPGGLDLLALDRGPGVARFERCVTDGFTTGTTLGTGLGAVRRLATSFEAVSEPGRGTAVLARFGRPLAATGVDAGAVGFPVRGEDVNGDAWCVVRDGDRVLALLADGLGHGPGAATASRAATEALPALRGRPVDQVVTDLHEALRGTRGAALSVVRTSGTDLAAGGPVQVAGLGNVSVLVADPDGISKRLATSHGTAGSVAPGRIPVQTYAASAGSTVVLHSDGLTARFGLEGRTALLGARALLVAAVLHRDHARATDDTGVLVLKPGRP